MTIPKKYQTGFTLVELLVALAVSMFVLMAVLGIFNSSSLSYNVQEDIAAVQQDIRVGKMFIERDARMAGAGLENYPPIAGLSAEDLSPFTVKNGAGVNESDILTIRYVIPLPGSCGEDPDPTDDIGSCGDLPPLSLHGAHPETSSIAEINEELKDNPLYDGWVEGCYCDDTTYTDPSFGFQFMIETPPGYSGEPKADVVILTGVSEKAQNSGNQYSQLQNHSTTVQQYGIDSDNKILNGYPDKSIIRFASIEPIETFLYYITEENVLMRDDLTDDAPAQPIAEHIEDLQFAFGLDMFDEFGNPGQDGEVDTWRDGNTSGDFIEVTDPDTSETYFDLAPDDKALIRTVRISLLGRTDKARRELSPEPRPALEDHAVATDDDYFRRRLSQVEVELRNVAIATN